MLDKWDLKLRLNKIVSRRRILCSIKYYDIFELICQCNILSGLTMFLKYGNNFFIRHTEVILKFQEINAIFRMLDGFYSQA